MDVAIQVGNENEFASTPMLALVAMSPAQAAAVQRLVALAAAFRAEHAASGLVSSHGSMIFDSGTSLPLLQFVSFPDEVHESEHWGSDAGGAIVLADDFKVLFAGEDGYVDTPHLHSGQIEISPRGVVFRASVRGSGELITSAMLSHETIGRIAVGSDTSLPRFANRN